MSVPVQAAGTSWRQMSQPAKSIHSATAPLALASARLAVGPATTPRAGRGATAAAAAAKGAASTSRRDGRSAPASPAMLQTSAARRSILDGVAWLTAIRWCAALQRSAVVAIGCTLCTAPLAASALQQSRAALRSGGGARTTTRCAGTTQSIRAVLLYQLHCAEQASLRVAARGIPPLPLPQAHLADFVSSSVHHPGSSPARRAAPATTTSRARHSMRWHRCRAPAEHSTHPSRWGTDRLYGRGGSFGGAPARRGRRGRRGAAARSGTF